VGFATTQTLLSKADLVSASDTIVVGHCAAITTEWRDKSLVTRYTIAVDEALHGTVGSELTLWVPGGIDQDRKIPIAVTVPGAPVLFADEEVLLFLVAVPGLEGYSLASLTQGKTTIHREPDGAAWLSIPFGSGFEGSSGRLSLESEKAEIQTLLEKEERQ